MVLLINHTLVTILRADDTIVAMRRNLGKKIKFLSCSAFFRSARTVPPDDGKHISFKSKERRADTGQATCR